MKYHHYGSIAATYRVAILVNDVRGKDVQEAYIDPYGLNPEDVIVLSLHQSQVTKKTSAAEMKAYINDELGPTLNDLKVDYVLIADGDYFKHITKSAKVDAALGYVLPTEYGPWNCIYIPNYKTIFHNPDGVLPKIGQAMDALKAHAMGTYEPPGTGIIKYSYYPETVREIKEALHDLLVRNVPLTIDIEGFSLKHYDSGIGSICFAWNQEEGIAFTVDFERTDEESKLIRHLLKEFFYEFQEKTIYHSIAFDVYVLIYQLFMTHLLDNDGLLEGLEVMLKNWDCTKLITYLATNSCAGNKLGLKDQAQEYAGNYAVEEIKDIRKLSKPKLLEYNLVDGLCTWYTHNKHYQTMVDDDQLDIYENIFKPSIADIIQMQLTGMPVDMDRVIEVEKILQHDSDTAHNTILQSPVVQKLVYALNEDWVKARNEKLKVKRVTLADANESFNPNSGPQLIKLLYEVCGLPILETTKTGLPATGGDEIKDLKNHTSDPIVLELLSALVDYKSVDKILTSFIPALKTAQQGNDGHYYLFGNFNLGGTVSGRLSSSNPNLQNLPATGSKYAKLIKSCFVAPKGWHFGGIDFNSLEDMISGLTSKDPNKLKVYTDGYDGHCLRAYAYFGEQMPTIDATVVTSINSIAKLHKDLRQESKVPTFSLTYDGTYRTLMAKCGFSKEKAQLIYTRFHELYKVSDDWVKAKLDNASKVGYVTVAFGLRVRTPLLAQVVRGTSKTPYEATAEGRTAGNALGQSWCLVNNRAGSEFMQKVRKSRFKNDIKPCAQIHDAQYYLVKDDIDAVIFTNNNLVKACEWQDHPDIEHPTVKLGGEFSIFYPDWSKEVGIPKNATAEQIYSAFSEHLETLSN